MSKIVIKHEFDPHVGRLAWVMWRGTEYVGCTTTEEGARETAMLVERFGYFDPNEPRQRALMR